MNEKSEVELFALPLHPGMPCREERHIFTWCVGEQPHDLGPIGTGRPVTSLKVDEEQHCSHRETLEILPLYNLLLLLPLPCYSSAEPRGTHEAPAARQRRKRGRGRSCSRPSTVCRRKLDSVTPYTLQRARSAQRLPLYDWLYKIKTLILMS